MGTVDIYHSRRTNYEECIYWIRDERNSRGPASEWILKNEPSGAFLAKEASPKNRKMMQSANVFAYDRDDITLECDDDIHFITRGSIIQYDDEIWIVDAVQRITHRKESEFDKEKHYKYIINMRK